jgi:hypothetical protein
MCPDVVTDLVAGINGQTSVSGLPHVEIRRCPPENAVQIVAWKSRAKHPSLTLNVARFSFGPILMDGNVFVIVCRGSYDYVVVIQYEHGEPKVAFEDSTHQQIGLSSEYFRGEVRRVVVTKNAVGARSGQNAFYVDEDELDRRVRPAVRK